MNERLYKEGFSYVNKMKHQGKKAYAREYLCYLLGKRNEPNYKDYNINVMAGQGVRLQLEHIKNLEQIETQNLHRVEEIGHTIANFYSVDYETLVAQMSFEAFKQEHKEHLFTNILNMWTNDLSKAALKLRKEGK